MIAQNEQKAKWSAELAIFVLCEEAEWVGVSAGSTEKVVSVAVEEK